MGLLSSALVSLCVGSTGSYQPACDNAVKATVKQTGVEAAADHWEKQQEKSANYWINQNINKDSQNYIGSTIYVYKVIRDKSLDVDLPKMSIADKITSKLTPDSIAIIIKWDL